MSRSERALRRRTFLTLAGLGVAAPLALRMSRLAVAAPGDRPRRLFIYYIPHGAPAEHWVGAGDDTLAGSTILAPLQPYADRVTVLRGVGMNDGASNHLAVRATLTGFQEGGAGDSIDRIIADELGVTPHVLGAIPYDKGAGFNSDAHLVKHGTWVRPTEDPADSVAALFAGLGDGTPQPGVDEAALRRQTLAYTERELERLHAALGDLSREQTKLALHLDAVRHLKAKADGGPPPPTSCDAVPDLPAVAACAGLDVLAQTSFAAVLDAQLEAAAHAFVCGSARVVTLQNLWVNSDMNFGFPGGPGIAKGHHDPISHSWDLPGRTEFATCQRWFYQRLADRLLAVLAQPDPLDIEDPTRSVLDNSLVYVCSEVSDGANHNSDASEVWIDHKPYASSLPLVMIGGGGGYLKGNQVVQVQRNHLDVLATLADAMGVPLGSIGGQNCSPITEVQA